MARLRDYWRFASLFPSEIRFEAKSWNEHRMAAMRSAEGRGHYNITLAMRLLTGEEDAREAVDPFVNSGLSSTQLEHARRIWRNRDDFADQAVTKAVTAVLRGKRRQGLETVANALHAHTLQKLRDAEAVAQASNRAFDIVRRYHTQMLKATDACYQLKLIVDSVPDAGARRAVKVMIEGAVYANSQAIEDLLDALDTAN